jgi:hypothetical protein
MTCNDATFLCPTDTDLNTIDIIKFKGDRPDGSHNLLAMLQTRYLRMHSLGYIP